MGIWGHLWIIFDFAFVLNYNKYKSGAWNNFHRNPGLNRLGVFRIMNSKLRDEHTDNLFKAILLLDNLEECYKFFEDICTIAEIKAIAQRLEVARMLRAGKTYTEITEKTGASTATISRVNRYLNYGSDGYRMILERMEEND